MDAYSAYCILWLVEMNYFLKFACKGLIFNTDISKPYVGNQRIMHTNNLKLVL